MQHTINAPVQPSRVEIKVPLQPVSTRIYSTPPTTTPPAPVKK